MVDLPAPAATAARALAGDLVRTALKAGGTYLVTHGVVTQGTLDGALDPVTQEVVGVAFLLAGFVWGQARAYLSHTRWAAAWAALTADAAAGEPKPGMPISAS